MKHASLYFRLRAGVIGTLSLLVAPVHAQQVAVASIAAVVPVSVSAAFPDFQSEVAQAVLEARYCDGKEIMWVITKTGVLLRFDRNHMPTNLEEFIPWINAAPIHDLANISC